MNMWIAEHSDGTKCVRATTTHDCPLNHEYRDRAATVTQNGMTVAPGDTLIDFRGDAHTFKRVSRLAGGGRAAKIETSANREFYAHVFPELEVIVLEG